MTILAASCRYDPDEIEEEQRERERRNQINRQFSQFVKRVQQDIWERDYSDLNLEFEIPFRELGFYGVPARSTSFIMPTVNCLVELTEMPFTVITLSEVNVVNLERVGFNLRNFDMIFIWKVRCYIQTCSVRATYNSALQLFTGFEPRCSAH